MGRLPNNMFRNSVKKNDKIIALYSCSHFDLISRISLRVFKLES